MAAAGCRSVNWPLKIRYMRGRLTRRDQAGVAIDAMI